MNSNVYAMAQAPAPVSGTQSAPSILQSPFIPMIGLFVILYFMMLRPQRKRDQTHKAFLAGLKKGDDVVTLTGLYGRIAGITEQVVTLEIANNVKIRVSKTSIAGLQASEIQPALKEAAKA